MPTVSLEFLTRQLELGEQLLAGRPKMISPQDLPGRYGRVVARVDDLLKATGGESVVGGGWAVWYHGYVARLTHDLDIVLSADRIDEFLRVASVSGFEVLQQPPGRWPKVLHKETGIEVDILPEGARPGTISRPAPTTIPHPKELGGGSNQLRYMTLARLIELKLAAGRSKDETDVVELIRANAEQVADIRAHLAGVHADYAAAFDRLARRAGEEQDR